MAFEIKVPAFGESITEGTIAQWVKKEGEWVNKGDTIVVIDSEKASTDLQAEASGVLAISTKAGADVPIGAVIGTINTDAKKPEGAPSGTDTPVRAPEKAKPAAAVTNAPARTPEKAVPVPPATSPARVEAPKPAIVERPAATIERVPTAQGNGSDTDGPVTRQPMTRLRRTLATRLVQARNETAMLTTFAEADMSAIMEMRKRHADKFFKRHGIKLGFMSFFVKAAVEALRTIPEVNASIDGNDIVYHHYYHVAVAVSTERGLVVPVIRDADQKSYADIEKELVDLAVRARDNKLGLNELRGGTFTITNGGIFGSMMSTPLLNPPQVGILGMHAIEDRPVAINGKVEIRPMMYLALSYDHRLIDGKEAVRFLGIIKSLVNEPERMLLGL
ncbi:MAG: 2-oxoglutarate dehydrogenase complex dihydrolipoyllysine-residue succinyltransferase [Candidatus Sumerlaeaceae bacterium]|nr:2-oxoglutarate dehydrogenase complex dihydrolipoyllysine-residue succinyltransferase [Candidatus Sumerlaeaceae bacterium]